jgi:hypothetical protein
VKWFPLICCFVCGTFAFAISADVPMHSPQRVGLFVASLWFANEGAKEAKDGK